MRAYAGTVDQRGLRWFLPEEVIPRDLLWHAVRAGLTHATTAVRPLLTDEDAEAIRAALSAARTPSRPATRGQTPWHRGMTRLRTARLQRPVPGPRGCARPASSPLLIVRSTS